MKKFKVLGERNTGTNFLEQLVRLNFDLPSTKVFGKNLSTESKDRTTQYSIASNDYIKDKRIRNKMLRNILRQRELDYIRLLHSEEEITWKHAQIDAELRRQIKEDYDDILFIAITRNPINFLLSLFAKPYNLIMHEYKTKSFSEFIRSPIVLNYRDRSVPIVKNPVLLWKIKTLSYCECKEKNYHLIKYEDLVLDSASFIKKLSLKFDLDLVHEDVKIPEVSTKDDNRTQQDFIDLVKHFSPLKHISQQDFEFICEELGDKCLNETGYEYLFK